MVERKWRRLQQGSRGVALPRTLSASLLLGICSTCPYVGTALEHTVVLPRFFPKDIESRWRYLGFILLVNGMLLQLISAVLGL